ncbi:MAG: NHL repeat-containing protein [Deltaproteobacteria bacterium]|nr:NHL repeat-containing protein [Deltaproteobacteria bacterium]MCL5276688.1 NHL repeat-containing protein [Deltaproteobacteria bacterium]
MGEFETSTTSFDAQKNLNCIKERPGDDCYFIGMQKSQEVMKMSDQRKQPSLWITFFIGVITLALIIVYNVRMQQLDKLSVSYESSVHHKSYVHIKPIPPNPALLLPAGDYVEPVTNFAMEDIQSPVGLLWSGFSGMEGILTQIHQPVRLVYWENFIHADTGYNQTFNSMRLLIITVNGFEDLNKSKMFVDAVDRYVYNGGNLLVFGQEFGDEFQALPSGQVVGYGWRESQLYRNKSVYAVEQQPFLTSFTGTTPNITIEGFFSHLPDGAKTILRSRLNGQPVLVMYHYGKGTVIATTSVGPSYYDARQMTYDDLYLIRDIISWLIEPDRLLEAKPGETITLTVSLTNEATNQKMIDCWKIYNDATERKPITYQVPRVASKAFIYIYTPGENSMNNVAYYGIPVKLGVGESQTASIQFTVPADAPSGIWHVSYNLTQFCGSFYGTVNTMPAQSNREVLKDRFVVSKPPPPAFNQDDITTEVTVPSIKFKINEPLKATIHVWSTRATDTTVTISGYDWHHPDAIKFGPLSLNVPAHGENDYVFTFMRHESYNCYLAVDYKWITNNKMEQTGEARTLLESYQENGEAEVIRNARNKDLQHIQEVEQGIQRQKDITQKTYKVGRTPEGVAIDASGNVWVANNGDNTVTKLNPDGTVIGNYKVGVHPNSIAIDTSGNVWVANHGDLMADRNGSVTELSSRGSIAKSYNVGGYPEGIMVDHSGNVWVLDAGKQAVYNKTSLTKIIPITSKVLDYLITGGGSTGMAMDVSQNLWVTNGIFNLNKIDQDGTLISTYKVIGASGGIAIDQSGNIWMTNYGRDTVAKLNTSGIEIGNYSAGVKPRNIAIDASDNLWIINDTDNNNVTEISSDGTLLTIYSAGSRPAGLAIDSKGNVWVTDTGGGFLFNSPSSNGSVIELIGAAKGPQYWPYTGPQWP